MSGFIPLPPEFLDAVRARIDVSQTADEIAARCGESVDDRDVAVPMLARLLEGYEAQAGEIRRLKIEAKTRADTLNYIRSQVHDIGKTLQILADHT